MAQRIEIKTTIFLIFALFIFSCQSQNHQTIDQPTIQQYIKKEGVFLIRFNPCYCLTDEIHSKHLEYEIMLITEDITQIQNIEEMNLILANQEKIYQKKWYEWGTWQRVYLADHIDQKILENIQDQKLILANGSVKNGYVEFFNHPFLILNELNMIVNKSND